MTSWPFSVAELTAGLRRYFAEPALQVRSLHEQPLPFVVHSDRAAGRARGLRVEYAVGDHALSVALVVKEPQGATPAGLAGAGRREVGLYRSLAPQLPMPVPALIAADPAGNWLVLEAVEAEVPPAAWGADDYGRGIKCLATLHERFWNLAEDLSAYPWLGRPVTGDFEIYVYGAARAVARIIGEDRPRLITGSADALGTLGQIISQAERVIEPLRLSPPTLLHGDFWPGNVALQSDGEMVVFDWKLASIGPAILDLVAFMTSSQWELGGLPVSADELVGLYREEVARRVNVRWTEAEWRALWDHALLWRFTQEMVVWAADAPDEVFAARASRFSEIWLGPVLSAADRRLAPIFAF